MDKPYQEWTIDEKIADTEKELADIKVLYNNMVWDDQEFIKLERFYGDPLCIVLENLIEYLENLKTIKLKSEQEGQSDG